MAGLVGSTGSRSLAAAYQPLVAAVVGSVLAGGQGVAVGCADGADLFVREAAPQAQVFSVASGKWGKGRNAYAARSVAMVKAVAASGPGAGLVGFVGGPCPAGIVPAQAWRSGAPPSGSWSTLALGVGLGLAVTVFWCSAARPQLPAWSGGQWVQGVGGVFAQGWQWQPEAVQGRLF